MVKSLRCVRFASIGMIIMFLFGCLGGEPVANSTMPPAEPRMVTAPPAANQASKKFYAYTDTVSCEAFLKSLENEEDRNNSLSVIGAFISGTNYTKGRKAGINIKTLAAVTEDYCRKTPKGNITDALVNLDRLIDKALVNIPKPINPSVKASPAASSAANQAKPNSSTVQPGKTNNATSAQPASVVGAAIPQNAAPGSSYGLQIHSTQDRKDADYYYAKLENRKYPAYITKVDLGGKGIWYRVMCGPFSKQSDAEKTLLQLEKQGIKGFLRKVDTTR